MKRPDIEAIEKHHSKAIPVLPSDLSVLIEWIEFLETAPSLAQRIGQLEDAGRTVDQIANVLVAEGYAKAMPVL